MQLIARPILKILIEMYKKPNKFLLKTIEPLLAFQVFFYMIMLNL